MKANYEHVLRQVADFIHCYYKIDVATKTVRGADFFPKSRMLTGSEDGGCTRYSMRFNPKVETLLRLYNRALEGGEDIGETVTHYALFHAFLEIDDYAGARCHLEAFGNEIERLGICSRTEEERTDALGQTLVQIYYILFHESFHIIFSHSPEQRSAAIATTRELLLDMKEELADLLSGITDEDLLSHPKTRERIKELVPPSLPQALREAMELQMYDEMKRHPYTTEYIDSLLGGSDDLLLEELTCDRQAWLTFVAMAQEDGMDSEALLQFHLWFYVVFCAMDFNRNLQSQYSPALRAGYRYDGRRIAFRHKAFKTLLRQYNPDVYRLIGSHYLDRHKGLEAIFRTATLGIFRYRDDFYRLHRLHALQSKFPDFRQICLLEDEMARIAENI